MRSLQHHLYVLLATATVVATAAAGCAAGEGSGGPGQSGPAADDCEQVAAAPPQPESPVTALVMDNTASGTHGPLPPAVLEALATAQAEQGQLLIIGVDGASQRPTPVHRVALDPRPGVDAPAADNARAIALACVAVWGREARPVAEGSAILEALAAAGREQPARVLVVSDGLANSGAMDLNVVGFDAEPDALAATLRRADALDPHLDGLQIVWAGFGESAVPLPQPARNSLGLLWQAVLGEAGAEVTFDPRTAAAAEPAPADLPADPVEMPEAAAVMLPCGSELVVPAALLFAPDSAELQRGADEVLRETARSLAENPDWTAEVSGHTANYGTEAGRQRLSTERAEVVKAALVRLGASESQVEASGYGATRPREPETPDHPGAAARNRRVEIEIHRPGCEQ